MTRGRARARSQGDPTSPAQLSSAQLRSAYLLLLPLLPQSVAALLPQPLQLPAQLLGILAAAAAAHERLQQLQHPHHLVHQADQGLAAEPVDDALKVVAQQRRYVVHVRDGELCRRPLQHRGGGGGEGARFHVCRPLVTVACRLLHIARLLHSLALRVLTPRDSITSHSGWLWKNSFGEVKRVRTWRELVCWLLQMVAHVLTRLLVLRSLSSKDMDAHLSQ